MNDHLIAIRELRKWLESKIRRLKGTTWYGGADGVAEIRKREAIAALRHCEYLLEVGESVHTERSL